MKQPKNLLFAPLPDALYRLPGGPKWVAGFYFVGWLCAHIFFIQSLITGRVPLRRTGALMGTILLGVDILVIRFLWCATKKEAIQPPEITRGK